ncbi:Helix-turn-helix protein [Streptomyces sp. YIM 121038]|uniref:helix-turn-helix domain-containing protein n=1 Tax=Streptomyces sp. YIM 121038 TaxID=2136401 RepID=UPI00111092F8|nr:helix-turn-helix transcriptional regulator [Streptomyces sp. YIM 121038]QCX79694.1 Helix-turn-helix protein [Streptomyces sp. YIM 121038]
MSRPKRRSRKNASAMKMVGALLALHRERAGYTQKSLAEHFVISEGQIASIEQGRRPLKMDLAIRLDELLGTHRTFETAVEHMPEVDLIPRYADEYLDQEQEAIVLEWYETVLIPGLLQTEAYARAICRLRIPAYTEEKIEELVAERIGRREILHRKNPPHVSFIIWEAALHSRVGGESVHTEQLRHLREYADLPNVCLQILPLSHGFTPSISAPFIVLETPEHQRLVYSETHGGSHLIAAPDEVTILASKYGMLRTEALNPEDSKELLDRLLGER